MTLEYLSVTVSYGVVKTDNVDNSRLVSVEQSECRENKFTKNLVLHVKSVGHKGEDEGARGSRDTTECKL